MIDVRISMMKGRVDKFSVSGHAGYEEAGRDIVCAAVSALVTNAINSCEMLLGVELPAIESEDSLSCEVPTTDADDSVQLLLQSMIFGIEQTAGVYPDRVSIKVQDDKRE